MFSETSEGRFVFRSRETLVNVFTRVQEDVCFQQNNKRRGQGKESEGIYYEQQVK